MLADCQGEATSTDRDSSLQPWYLAAKRRWALVVTTWAARTGRHAYSLCFKCCRCQLKTTWWLQQALFKSINGMKDLTGHGPRQSGLTTQLPRLRAGGWTGDLPRLDLYCHHPMTRWWQYISFSQPPSGSSALKKWKNISKIVLTP